MGQARFCCMEILAALKHVHGQMMMYRDLKPENLLLDSEGHVRITDFGTAKQSDSKKAGVPPASREECGTRRYMAPEVRFAEMNNEPYDYRCDYYSMGVVMYELFEKELPFGEQPLLRDMEAEFREPQLIDEETGDEIPHLFNLLAGMLDWDPTQRVVDTELQESLFWEGADWEAVNAGRAKSPLADYVRAKLHKGRHRSRKSKQESDVISQIVRSFSASKAKLKELGQRTALQASNSYQVVSDQELEMSVDAWDFVSEHALAQEYVETEDKVISVV